MIRIGLIGDYRPEVKAHIAIPEAIRLAAKPLGVEARFDWIATPALERDAEGKLAGYQAIWSVPASPYASMQGALNGIEYARTHRVPFIGTCGGFQHMVLEFARNVLGFREADHAEMNPDASELFIIPLACSVNETTHVFRLSPGSKVARIYGHPEITEQYGTCRYGLNRGYVARLEEEGLKVAGVDLDGETRIMELAGHPFYVGMLFQPERSSFKNLVHPLIRAFLEAASTN
ncbi:CTP synthase C-terminal region-related (seleno)protein [Paenibacillus macerans]|uniref:CTP synthase C-terminal region-related (seleno)protein n=1 Tax=Paenibacillus macerans TaxID=44252 RepID=UPI003D320880